MFWMILHPRELELVRDAVIRGRRDKSQDMVGFWSRVETKLKGDELEVTDADFAFLKRWIGIWTTGYQNAFRAIASAVDRHS
jgi:hypothetical protein